LPITTDYITAFPNQPPGAVRTALWEGESEKEPAAEHTGLTPEEDPVPPPIVR